MKTLFRLIYQVNRLVLFALGLAFLSFYLVTRPEMTEYATPVVEAATQYLPILLVPVTIAMGVVLLFRYIAKKRNEKVSFGDVFAGILALVGQLGVIAIYRAQGGEVLNSSFLTNMPNVTELATKAAPMGILAVVILQFVTFFLYWVADPNKKSISAS